MNQNKNRTDHMSVQNNNVNKCPETQYSELLVVVIFAGPKRGVPTPGFSIFIHLFVCSFVSLDQILVPTHSLRDKGKKGQKDTGTKGKRD